MPPQNNKLKKKNKNRGGGGGGGREGWSILDPIDSKKKLNRIITRRTGGAINPLLREQQREKASEREATQGRQKDIGQWYGSYDDRLNQAFTQTNQALNSMIASNSAGNAQAQAALAAALSSTGDQDRALAERIGAAPIPNAADEGALQTFASAEALRGQQGTSAGALLAGTGARRELGALSQLRSREDEQERTRAIINDINRKMGDIRSSRPEVREAMRKAIMDEELAKQGQSFQQRIAGQELKLSKRAQSLAERQQSHQEGLDRANLALQEKQLKAQIAQAVADGKVSQGEGDAAITKMQVARTQLEKFVEAQTGKGKKGGKITDRDAYNLFSMLTNNYKVPRNIALKVMQGSGVGGLRRWAKKKASPHRKGGGAIGGAADIIGGIFDW